MPRIQIDGLQVELVRQGRGEPVVLLHAGGSSSAQWRALVDRLSARYLVLAPDLYGHGGTAPWPGDGEFSLAREAVLVHALLDGLDEPAHLVGHSYGGAVALQVARTRAGGLRSLALIEPVAAYLLRDGNDADQAALEDYVAAGNIVMQALCRGDYMGGFGRFVDYWNGPGTWAGIPAPRRASVAASLPAMALLFHAQTAERSRLQGVRGLAVPTLLVRGSHTLEPTRRVCELLALAWPEARTHIVTGAGHMAPVTHRDQVNDLLAAHIAETAASRAGTAASPA